MTAPEKIFGQIFPFLMQILLLSVIKIIQKYAQPQFFCHFFPPAGFFKNKRNIYWNDNQNP